MLTNRRDTIVAGATSAQHLGVIHGKCGRPHIRVVAIFTDVCRLYVCWAFARGFGAVVAAEAVACDVDVIEISR